MYEDALSSNVTLFFLNHIFPPSTVKISPVFPRLSLIFARFLYRSSYFFPGQPILHIFAPPPKKNIYINTKLRIYSTPL